MNNKQLDKWGKYLFYSVLAREDFLTVVDHSIDFTLYTVAFTSLYTRSRNTFRTAGLFLTRTDQYLKLKFLDASMEQYQSLGKVYQRARAWKPRGWNVSSQRDSKRSTPLDEDIVYNMHRTFFKPRAVHSLPPFGNTFDLRAMTIEQPSFQIYQLVFFVTKFRSTQLHVSIVSSARQTELHRKGPSAWTTVGKQRIEP